MRVGRRDTLDEKLGIGLLRAVEIEGQASVFLEYAFWTFGVTISW